MSSSSSNVMEPDTEFAIVSNNILNDDKLISIIKEELNETDNILFEMSYKLYQVSYNNTDKFVINFNDIYKWVGFTQKCHAKTLLINKFKENEDYKLIISRSRDNSRQAITRGRNSEQILLTIQCFKKFCMKAETKESDKIYDYYIKLEEIIFKYIQEHYNNKLHEKDNKLQEKEKEIQEKNRQLEIKDNRIRDQNNIITTYHNMKYE